MLARTPSLFAWCRILIAILFAFDRVTADCDIDVYVPQEVLENYFENNINTDGNLYLISDCEGATVDEDGYLIYTEGTNDTIPPLLGNVDSITLSWGASDKQANYTITAMESSVNSVFESVTISVPAKGAIADYPNGVSVVFPCSYIAEGTGVLRLGLQVETSEYGIIDTEFLLQKDCQYSVDETLVYSYLSTVQLGTMETVVTTPTFSPYFSKSLVPMQYSSILPSHTASIPFQSSVPFQSSIQFQSSVLTQTTTDPPSSSSEISIQLSTHPPSSSLPSSSLPSSSPPSSLSSSPSSIANKMSTSTPMSVLSSSTTTRDQSYTSLSLGTPDSSPGLAVEEEGPPWLLFAIVFAPLVGFLLLAIFIIICCMCCIKCGRKKSPPSSSVFCDNPNEIIHVHRPGYDLFELEEEEEDKYKNKDTFRVSLWTALSWGRVYSLPLQIQRMIKAVNIDRRKLTITNTFLRVDNGCLSNAILLVDNTNPMITLNQGTMLKMMTGLGEGSHRDNVLKFIEQVLSLQGLEHTNVMKVIGMSVEDDCMPLGIYPMMEYGNLHSFLELARVSPESCPLNPFGEEYKANFGLQLVAALKFLCEKGIVHHDVALRNCWLDSNYVLKLSDGALSQEFYPQCYSTIKGALRPVKWAALETLQEGLITVQSNVWSSGVVLWEIFSMAESPYTGVPNRSVISHLMMDERLPKPDNCTDDIYQLMKECWKTRGEERPAIASIENRLTYLSTKLPTIVYPRGQTLFSPRSTEPTFTTFMSSTDNHRPISTEMYLYKSLDDAPNRHSGASAISDVIMRRPNGAKKRTSGHMSGTSIGRGGDQLSLSFSVLSGDMDSSSSDSDDGGGSFPSTLKSTRSGTTMTTDNGGVSTTVGGSISTLQHSSPLGVYPQSESPDISKTSTIDDSTSAHSSVMLQQTAPSISGTDRSSFYSTGIDSVSTTFSTPLPNSIPANHTPTIELKTYTTYNDDTLSNRSRPIETSSVSPFTGKSTDSGIRSDEDTPFSNGHLTVNSKPDQTRNELGVNNRNSAVNRDSSHDSRLSFDLGLSDMLEQFSFK